MNQRTVEALVGLPRERYLELARGGAFPATKVQRLVVARTVDVLGYFERRLQPRGPRIARATGEEAASEPRLVRAGFRRLVRLDHAQARAQERS